MENQYQKLMIRLIVLIAFFLPFEYLGSFEFQGITIRISQILTVILIILWLLALFAKKIDYQKNYLTLPLIIFLGINLFSLIKASNFIRSLAVFFFLFFTILWGWLITQIIRDKNNLTKIIIALFLGAFLVSLFGFWQFFGDVFGVSREWTGLRPNYVKEKIGFPRIHSTAYEPLYYANYLFVPLFLFLALWLGEETPFLPAKLWQIWRTSISPLLKKRKKENPSLKRKEKEDSPSKIRRTKGLFSFLIFLLLGNLILTVSRGAYLAFIPTLGIFILLFFRELKPKKWAAFFLLLALTIIFNWQLIHYFDRSSYFSNQLKFEEHVANFLGGSSFRERKETITLAWQAFKENPILGLGIGGFGPYAKIHLPWWQQNEWKIVNNEYLEILAETGILGFISFIVLIAIIIYKSWQTISQTKDNYLKTILIGFFTAFIAILIQYITFSTLYIMHIWFLIGIIVATEQIIKKTNIINKSPIENKLTHNYD